MFNCVTGILYGIKIKTPLYQQYLLIYLSIKKNSAYKSINLQITVIFRTVIQYSNIHAVIAHAFSMNYFN